MKRTTISLPDDLARVADREARRRGGSFSELVREALAEYLGLGGEARRKLPFANLGGSGHRHTARDAEEILAREWAEEPPRRGGGETGALQRLGECRPDLSAPFPFS